MKLASFCVGGRKSFGIVTGGGIIDLAGKVDATDLIGAITQLDRLRGLPTVASDLKLDAVEFLPVIPNPSKILCVGVNYHSHLKETGRPTTPQPMIFSRFANSQIGHLAPMVCPEASEQFDYEGELAVIIGRGGRHIPKADAQRHIAGYSCYNDGTLRDWQRHTTQFIPGKNFMGTGAFGPWLVTPDAFGRVEEATLITRLNGEEVQRATLDDLIFDVGDLIAYCSTFTELEAGDVIVTGTTGGVGAYRTPPLWMRPGDRVEVEISNIGTLSNTIVAES